MDDVDHLLDTGDLAALIGRIEGPQLEAKGAPYDLTNAATRFELAKDVSAFANQDGGHLIVGAVTERAPDAEEDVIARIESVDPAVVQPGAYLGVLEQYVYPRPAGVTCRVILGADGATNICVIRVPPQDRERGPFLVLRVQEGGEELSQTFVGFFERIGAANEPMDARRIHKAFRDGMSATSVRLDRIEAKIDAVAAALRAEEPRVALLEELEDARIDRLLKENE